MGDFLSVWGFEKCLNSCPMLIVETHVKLSPNIVSHNTACVTIYSFTLTKM